MERPTNEEEKALKRVLASVALAACLLAAFVVPASAHASTGPDVPDCSTWSTVAFGSTVTDGAGRTITASLQRGSPGYCTNLRSKIVYTGNPMTIYGYTCEYIGYWLFSLDGSALVAGNYTLYTNSHDYGGQFPHYFKAHGELYWEGTFDAAADSPSVWLT